MKVDWKRFSQCKGYKSLKAAYIADLQDANKERQKGRRPMRNKAEFIRTFRHAISTTIANAAILGMEPWDLLDQQEDRRDYWWLNFYGRYNYRLLKPDNRTYPKPKDPKPKSSKRRWSKDRKSLQKYRRGLRPLK